MPQKINFNGETKDKHWDLGNFGVPQRTRFPDHPCIKCFLSHVHRTFGKPRSIWPGLQREGTTALDRFLFLTEGREGISGNMCQNQREC